jgi:hypothetical protein
MPSPYPAARIAVDAAAWRAFRQAAIVRGIPMSVYLGKLVEAELGRRDATPSAAWTPRLLHQTKRLRPWRWCGLRSMNSMTSPGG